MGDGNDDVFLYVHAAAFYTDCWLEIYWSVLDFIELGGRFLGYLGL